MAITINQKFVSDLQTLTQEILSDEAFYLFKKQKDLSILHQRVFSASSNISFENLPTHEKEFFNKYFYNNRNTTSPKADNPFRTNTEYQGFFIDQLRKLSKVITYNFERLDFIRPSFVNKDDQNPVFNSQQIGMITKGLVFPIIYSIEKREIANLERNQGVNADNEEGSSQVNDQKSNPFDLVSDKVLVQNISGEFNIIMTYAQIEELSLQIDIFRKQGLDDQQISNLIREYIKKRFPNLNIYISPTGNIRTFLGQSGISASFSDSMPVTEDQSLTQVLQEMRFIQGRKLQFDAILASNFNLAYATPNFKVGQIFMDGMELGLNQSGFGSQTISFVTDREGVSARLLTDTSVYRTNGRTNYHLSLYDRPDQDSPSSPKIRLTSEDLPKLQTPLLSLYGQLQQPQDVNPHLDSFRIQFPKESISIPGDHNISVSQPSDQLTSQSRLPFFQRPNRKGKVPIEDQREESRIQQLKEEGALRSAQPTRKVKPKLSERGESMQGPQKILASGETTMDQNIQQKSFGNIEEDSGRDGIVQGKGELGKLLKPALIVGVSTAVPIIAAIGSTFSKIIFT